ncbi:muconolactone Delta-isomerase [Nocardioides humi]|uniref:Muconolactone isomerase domain-containing protein n=1 Tax=Nocardioides humi TaxID=449461 RepID=A0ABN2BKQ7_9ACTN|nr:muconolactone Delta-isomerase family protein [Nocardioides humi]
MEFLVELVFDAESVPVQERDELLARERETALELKRTGVIQRMWRVEGRPATVSVWRAQDAEDLDRRLGTLPLRPHLTASVTALGTHYLEED